MKGIQKFKIFINIRHSGLLSVTFMDILLRKSITLAIFTNKGFWNRIVFSIFR